MTTEALADLRRELAELRAEVAALRAVPPVRRAPRPRPRRFLAALLAAALLVTMPLGLVAANFQDLNAGSPHNPDINLVADAGISKGCFDTAHYCPDAFVTREQMASFLARTAGLGSNPPVVNAATIQGRAPGDLLRVGLNHSADTVDLTTPFPQFQVIALVQMQVPAPGFVLVNGTVTIGATSSDCDGGPNGQVCSVFIRLRESGPGGAVSNEASVVVNTGNNQATAGQTFVFPAAAGAHSYVIEARTVYADKVEASAPTLTALYVPFDANGAAP